MVYSVRTPPLPSRRRSAEDPGQMSGRLGEGPSHSGHAPGPRKDSSHFLYFWFSFPASLLLVCLFASRLPEASTSPLPLNRTHETGN